jgi:radical SAM superfamily enzyme YgiQ (UPF0313 family)
MKVLLVDPPFHAFFEYDRWWYSYASAQIAAYLRENGIEAYVYDADKYFKKDPKTQNRDEMVQRQHLYQDGVKNDNHYIWKHFRHTLDKINPDIVSVATWTSKMQSAFKTLEICKEFNPEMKICVGGYHASAKPEDFKHNPLIDTIFTGPAEFTMLEWIVNGCKEKFVAANPRSIDVTKLPPPSRESLLYPEHFTATDMSMIMTSRGCPYDCTFCSNRLLTGKKYQMRTIDHVKEEIEHIKNKYNIKSLYVADANFIGDIKKSLEMAKLFKSFDLPWGCETKINVITKELLEKLISYGCTHLSFGIETGTNAGMKILNKKITVEQVYRASKILNKYKMIWKCFFIVGFPHETLEDIEATRQLALSIGASYISLNSFVPLPGTEIYNTYKSKFDEMSSEIYEYNQLSPRATFLRGISPENYKEKFISILKDFDNYNNSMKAVEDFHEKKQKNL